MELCAQTAYVSTDLQITGCPDRAVSTTCKMGEGYEEMDIILDAKVYRLLSPTYYAYLRRQMEKARSKYNRRQMPATRWTYLKEKFNEVHELAVARWGEEELARALDAMQGDALAGYVPPMPRKSSQDGQEDAKPANPPIRNCRELYASYWWVDATPEEWAMIHKMQTNGTWIPPATPFADILASSGITEDEWAAILVRFDEQPALSL